MERLKESAAKIAAELVKIHDQKLGLGHFFNRVAQAFTTEARIFDAAVRHVVDAERRDVPGDETADYVFGQGGIFTTTTCNKGGSITASPASSPGSTGQVSPSRRTAEDPASHGARSRHAPHRGPPDPPVRRRAHDRLPPDA